MMLDADAPGCSGYRERSRLNVDTLIRGFASVLQGASGQAITLKLDLTDPRDVVDVDATQFKAALLNLVVNAREAMSDRQPIVLSTAIADIEDDNPVSPRLSAGRYAAITISDSGQGITIANLDHVFEPFFSSKEVGSGLGLSQVYGFATQAGGGVGIVTAVGKGTDVTIYLPPMAQAAHAAGGGDSALASQACTVLLVEDDEHVRRSTFQAIELLGYRVVAESNGSDALSRLRGDGAIDILFTDVVMGRGISGVTLAHEARSLRPELHVLLASGHPRETIEWGRGLEEFAFLAKPYRLQELAIVLKGLQGNGAG